MPCGGCGKGVVGKVAHGAVGLTKAALGVDRPDDLMVDLRLRTCRACDQLGRQFYCKVCKCIVAAKVRLMSEECPRNKWPKPETVEAMTKARRRPPTVTPSRRGKLNGR